MKLSIIGMLINKLIFIRNRPKTRPKYESAMNQLPKYNFFLLPMRELNENKLIDFNFGKKTHRKKMLMMNVI